VSGGKCVCCFSKEARPKCKDKSVFSIPCKIENLSFNRAMLDVGASINVMPRSVYDKLHLGELKKTDLIIQLANKSNALPKWSFRRCLHLSQ